MMTMVSCTLVSVVEQCGRIAAEAIILSIRTGTPTWQLFPCFEIAASMAVSPTSMPRFKLSIDTAYEAKVLWYPKMAAQALVYGNMMEGL